MSNLQAAVEMITNEFLRRYAIAPTIRLIISSDKMTEEDATKIAEEVAKEIGLPTLERDSRNGIHWVSAEGWAPDVEVIVFYDKEEDRCSQCPFLKMER